MQKVLSAASRGLERSNLYAGAPGLATFETRETALWNGAPLSTQGRIERVPGVPHPSCLCLSGCFDFCHGVIDNTATLSSSA